MNWVKINKKTKSHWSTVSFNISIFIFGRSVRFLFWSHFTMGSRYRSLVAIARHRHLLSTSSTGAWLSCCDYLLINLLLNRIWLCLKSGIPWRNVEGHRWRPKILCPKTYFNLNKWIFRQGRRFLTIYFRRVEWAECFHFWLSLLIILLFFCFILFTTRHERAKDFLFKIF